jgi:hypothetical protein
MNELNRLFSAYVRGTKSIHALDDILMACWCRDTARPEWQAAWNDRRPWTGQDQVTALIVLLVFRGGWLQINQIPEVGEHWYNRVPNGEGFVDHDYVGVHYRMPVHVTRGYATEPHMAPHFRQLAQDQVDNRLRAETMLAEDPDLKRRYELLCSRVQTHLEQLLAEVHDARR